MDETITTPRPKRRVEAISDLPSRLGAPCVGGAHGRWTIQQGDVQSMAASGPSVWTGRALQAESYDLEVMGLALLYPALEWNVCVPGHHGYPRALDLIRVSAPKAIWARRPNE